MRGVGKKVTSRNITPPEKLRIQLRNAIIRPALTYALQAQELIPFPETENQQLRANIHERNNGSNMVHKKQQHHKGHTPPRTTNAHKSNLYTYQTTNNNFLGGHTKYDSNDKTDTPNKKNTSPNAI